MSYIKRTFVNGSTPPIDAEWLNSLDGTITDLLASATNKATAVSGSTGKNYIISVDGYDSAPTLSTGDLISLLFVPTKTNETPCTITWGDKTFPLYDATTYATVGAGKLFEGVPVQLIYDGTYMWVRGGSRYLEWALDLVNGEDGYWDTKTDAATGTSNIRYNGDMRANHVYCAVWNDFAEYRQATENIGFGRVVVENGDDSVSMSTERLQPCAMVVSDTYGIAIGAFGRNTVPVAVAGRVLVYTDTPAQNFKAGDPVCSGANGTISKMSREEVVQYPDRMIGVVSSVPEYESWGNGIAVNGRIWIRVK